MGELGLRRSSLPYPHSPRSRHKMKTTPTSSNIVLSNPYWTPWKPPSSHATLLHGYPFERISRDVWVTCIVQRYLMPSRVRPYSNTVLTKRQRFEVELSAIRTILNLRQTSRYFASIIPFPEAWIVRIGMGSAMTIYDRFIESPPARPLSIFENISVTSNRYCTPSLHVGLVMLANKFWESLCIFIEALWDIGGLAKVSTIMPEHPFVFSKSVDYGYAFPTVRFEIRSTDYEGHNECHEYFVQWPTGIVWCMSEWGRRIWSWIHSLDWIEALSSAYMTNLLMPSPLDGGLRDVSSLLGGMWYAAMESWGERAYRYCLVHPLPTPSCPEKYAVRMAKAMGCTVQD